MEHINWAQRLISELESYRFMPEEEKEEEYLQNKLVEAKDHFDALSDGEKSDVFLYTLNLHHQI
jgi:hypothetical protein